jgi:hypothetical protein
MIWENGTERNVGLVFLVPEPIIHPGLLREGVPGSCTLMRDEEYILPILNLN